MQPMSIINNVRTPPSEHLGMKTFMTEKKCSLHQHYVISLNLFYTCQWNALENSTWIGANMEKDRRQNFEEPI